MCYVQRLDKSVQVLIREINEQVSNSEGDELFSWESIALCEGGK